jgi:hypothetical protein
VENSTRSIGVSSGSSEWARPSDRPPLEPCVLPVGVPDFMECLLSGFMVRDGLLCFVPPKSFSLSGRQAWIVLYLSSLISSSPSAPVPQALAFSIQARDQLRWITTHTARGRLRTRRLNPAGFPLAFAARGAMLTGEPFNPTSFGTDGITSEPNRAAHRFSKRL